MNTPPSSLPPALAKLSSSAPLQSALAGAVGGFAGFLTGEIIFALNSMGASSAGVAALIFKSASWSACIGTVLGAAVLVHDNIRSLRGQWDRDLWVALPVLLVLSFLGGVAGQAFFLLEQNSFTRGIGWALMGLGVGAGIGLVRRNLVQAGRGALGGAIGGFIGGLIFDSLSFIAASGNGSISRCMGLIIMGALIALLIRVVQDVLRSAWLLGITTGPYEGKEYTLSANQVTVGQGENNDICLYRLPDVPHKLGELVFHSDNWWWSGDPIGINGVPQTSAPVKPGDTLTFGSSHFRFQSRSVKAPVAPIAPPDVYSQPTPISTPTHAVALVLVGTDGRRYALPFGSGTATVGRLPSNDIVLSDAAVSSNHARFEVSGRGLSLTDMSSTNGTFVNGRQLAANAPANLRPGDRVKFAALEFVVSE